MPKRVDHEARRREIADALLRVAAERGLHNAGFREVAAEAGVSVRLVQYYFQTKEQLLLFGLGRVGEQFGQRVLARLAASGALPSPSADTTLDPPTPDDTAPADPASAGAAPAPAALSVRDRIELVLLATLPLDEESRPLYVVYNQYFALALTDPALAALPYATDPDVLEKWLVEQLRASQTAGHLPPTTDLADESVTLAALTVGLGNAVLAGTRSAADARRLLARYLDQRLGPS